MCTTRAGQQAPRGHFLRPSADEAAVVRQRVGDAHPVALQQQSVIVGSATGGHLSGVGVGVDGAPVGGEQKRVSHGHGGGVHTVRFHGYSVHSNAYVRPTLRVRCGKNG